MRRSDRETRDMNEIKAVLEQCKTANLAMVDGGEPYVVPLSYGYELADGRLTLYFHCAKEGRKLDILHKNSRVCFAISSEGKPTNADTPCNSGYYYSSLIGNGNVEFLEAANEKCAALAAMYFHQSGDSVDFTPAQANTVCVFKIVTGDFTAKIKR